MNAVARRLARLFAPSVRRGGNDTAGEPGIVAFACNICGASCRAAIEKLEREGSHCPACDCTMRYRAVIHHLSTALFGRSLCIDQFPASARRLTGIGMSDSPRYAKRLAARLDYTNTYYHMEPRLDVLAPPREYLDRFRFVVSSDVLEHVAPPIDRAFANLHAMLVAGGTLVLTVPFAVDGDTIEHYPELHDYRIEQRAGGRVLVNRTIDGRVQEFDGLVFHGGPGTTLEMRLFSEGALRRHLHDAGFRDIRVHREHVLERGIYWAHPWSVPITAIA